jgi:hypothetical protein
MMQDGDSWTAAMRDGDFARAWKINDAHLRRRRQEGSDKHVGPRHLQHIWTGEPLQNRRVLVRCYHGLGDTIQFIRFAEPLRRLAREVIVWVQPELMSLVGGCRGVDRVLPLHDGAPEVSYDADIEVMELAHALRASPASLPGCPYLFPATQAAPCINLDTSPFRVGIVWQAGGWDPRRSVSAEALAPLASIAGVTLHSLQPGASPHELEMLAACDMSNIDIEGCAATMLQLDLIISVDSMPAHLAGAIGAPVLTLLHHDCDWRWMRAGDKSCWYPTMRLVRQPSPGDWDSVIATIMRQLSAAAVRRD